MRPASATLPPPSVATKERKSKPCDCSSLPEALSYDNGALYDELCAHEEDHAFVREDIRGFVSVDVTL